MIEMVDYESRIAELAKQVDVGENTILLGCTSQIKGPRQREIGKLLLCCQSMGRSRVNWQASSVTLYKPLVQTPSSGSIHWTHELMQSIASRASFRLSWPFKSLSSRVARRYRARKQRRAMASKQYNSKAVLTNQRVHQRQSSETTHPSDSTSNNTPRDGTNNTTWNSIKASLKTRRKSISEIFKRVSNTSSSEDSGAISSPISDSGPDPKKDEENSKFCDTLLGLMQRTGRFDYLDFGWKGALATTEDHGDAFSESSEDKSQSIRVSDSNEAATVFDHQQQTVINSDEENLCCYFF